MLEGQRQAKLSLSVETLSQTLQQERRRLQMLLEVSSLVASNSDLPRLFPKISAKIRRVLAHEYASFALEEPGSGSLISQVIDFPLGKGFVSTAQTAAIDGPSAHVFQQRSPRIFSNDDLRAFRSDSAKRFLAEGIKSLCCVPLLRPEGPLGVFVLGSTRQGAFQSDDVKILEQVATQLALAIENRRSASEIQALQDRLNQERNYLQGVTRAEGDFTEIVGESPALQQTLDQVSTVASSDATVLILGDTGTGKELIARAIHRMSRRKDASFVKVNCAAIPTGLLESELFGHEKGAFTGAISQKIGRIELAGGGTLFLDEIGEIPPELQPKLLRVLQDQEFERLGSNRTIHVNLRVVAATNRDLHKSIAQQQFRSDLFYRLSVFPIRVPSLHERRDDIPRLVRYFVHKFAKRMNRHVESIPTETMNALLEWPWPGNVRELENLMERSVILSRGSTLHVPLSELGAPAGSETAADHTLDNAERQHIIRVLKETSGVISGPQGAARRLGLKRTTLQSKMQRLKITRNDYSPPRS